MDLTWYGGEPLLAFDRIKKLYKLLKEDGMPEIRHQSIVTNGYLFTEEICDFFYEQGLNSIQITLDGWRDKHNQTRFLKGNKKGTFDVIYKNIELILSKIPNVFLSIRVNIDKNSIGDFIEVYKMVRNDFKDNNNISAHPGYLRIETPDRRSICNSCIDSESVLDFIHILEDNGIDTSTFPDRKTKGCMLQSSNSFIIGPKGEIYKCWNDVSDGSKIIGYIDKDEITNKSLYIRYMTDASPFNDECKDCSAFPLCDGGCGYYRYRNAYENGRFNICSHLKNKTLLQDALLNEFIK